MKKNKAQKMPDRGRARLMPRNGTRNFSRKRLLMIAMGMKEIQIAELFNRRTVMSGTFAVFIIFYKVLLRRCLMSSAV